MQSLHSFARLGVVLFAALHAPKALAGVTAWVPLEVRHGHVLFPVEVAGVPSHALFDTGAQGNSVSSELVANAGLALHGKRYTIRGVSSTEENVASVSRLPIRLFGVDFKLHDVPVLPHSAALIIGAGFLKTAVLQLDYPNHRMRLITRDSIDLAKVANVPVRLVAESGLPALQVTVDGTKRWMLLDTGNTGPILMRRMVAEQSNWIGRFPRASGALVDVNADVAMTDVLVLPSIVIGPFELTDVPVQVPAANEEIRIAGTRRNVPVDDSRIRTGVRISGVVGYEVLRHFVVTLDYEREKLHLAVPREEKTAPESEPDPPPPPS
jgi:predicted aspartyl protease